MLIWPLIIIYVELQNYKYILCKFGYFQSRSGGVEEFVLLKSDAAILVKQLTFPSTVL